VGAGITGPSLRLLPSHADELQLWLQSLQLEAMYRELWGVWGDCGPVDFSTTIEFSSAGTSISTPMRSLVSIPTDVDVALFAEALQGLTPPGMCILAIVNLGAASFANILLGGSLLHQACVVYDLVDRQLRFAAPTNPNFSSSNVIKISPGPGSITTALQSAGIGVAAPPNTTRARRLA